MLLRVRVPGDRFGFCDKRQFSGIVLKAWPFVARRVDKAPESDKRAIAVRASTEAALPPSAGTVAGRSDSKEESFELHSASSSPLGGVDPIVSSPRDSQRDATTTTRIFYCRCSAIASSRKRATSSSGLGAVRERRLRERRVRSCTKLLGYLCRRSLGVRFAVLRDGIESLPPSKRRVCVHRVMYARVLRVSASR